MQTELASNLLFILACIQLSRHQEPISIQQHFYIVLVYVFFSLINNGLYLDYPRTVQLICMKFNTDNRSQYNNTLLTEYKIDIIASEDVAKTINNQNHHYVKLQS